MEEILKQLIIDQNESQVDELLKNEDIDINAMFLLEGSDKEVSFPILHYAIFVKNVNIIKSLIKYGVDINLRNTLGSSPLNMAIDTLNEDIALLLIKNGADINHIDILGHSILYEAMNSNCKKITNKLIRLGADLTTPNDKNCMNCKNSKSKSKCSGCNLARYCSKACQEQDWEAHKSICRCIKKELEKYANSL